jgi:hypothetical protein
MFHVIEYNKLALAESSARSSMTLTGGMTCHRHWQEYCFYLGGCLLHNMAVLAIFLG